MCLLSRDCPIIFTVRSQWAPHSNHHIQVRRGLEPFCVTTTAVDIFLKQLYRDVSTIVTAGTLIEVPNIIRPSLQLNTTARLLALPLFQILVEGAQR